MIPKGYEIRLRTLRRDDRSWSWTVYTSYATFIKAGTATSERGALSEAKRAIVAHDTTRKP